MPGLCTGVAGRCSDDTDSGNDAFGSGSEEELPNVRGVIDGGVGGEEAVNESLLVCHHSFRSSLSNTDPVIELASENQKLRKLEEKLELGRLWDKKSPANARYGVVCSVKDALLLMWV